MKNSKMALLATSCFIAVFFKKNSKHKGGSNVYGKTMSAAAELALSRFLFDILNS